MADDQKSPSSDSKKEEDKQPKENHKDTDVKNDSKSDESTTEELKVEDSPFAKATEDQKAALDEVIEEADKPKSKKGKSDYQELKAEEIKPGMLIRVHQKIVDTNPKGEEKERTQIFQGMVLAHKHGLEAGATIMVRKVSEGVGVEKIFPLSMPSLTKFELVRKYKVTQGKPYYLRTTKKRLKEIKE
ncbi:hypothetical protein CL632_01260 [bacterium]|jgi:large subunit ribosomal protein L19|nr:hypothetical protein [bacterium]MDP6756509.1 50S ribosomal protein L19 [Patescibacteria group bacterium]|tara:strand:- start:4322 stop:4882 length:561 start_codon:yes stop_codon:yes gene_type:complete